MKLVVLRINRYTTSGSQFQKGWWPLIQMLLTVQENSGLAWLKGKLWSSIKLVLSTSKLRSAIKLVLST